jgi:hypothetical protein
MTKGLINYIESVSPAVKSYGDFSAKSWDKFFNKMFAPPKSQKFIIYAGYLLIQCDEIFKIMCMNKNAECLGGSKQIKQVIERAEKLGVKIQQKTGVKKYG